MNRFDMLRLSIPNEIVQFDSTKFKCTEVDGQTISWKYEQKQPFYYSVYIDENIRTTYLEFSGKALLNSYPELIDMSNFSCCIENINAYNVIYMPPMEVLRTAMVLRCDVSCDISTGCTISDIYSNLQLANNKTYSVTTSAHTRFTIENTAVTTRCKERLLVYDKHEEMKKRKNSSFLQAIPNAEEIKEYYKDKIRLELNIKSTDRLQHFFHTSDFRLTTILNSEADPIGAFLNNAIAKEKGTDILKKYSYRLRDAERLLMLCLCNYDMTTIEKTIREIVGPKRSIKNIMKPYRALYASIASDLTESVTTHLKDVQENLMKALSRVVTDTTSTTLTELYHKCNTPPSKDDTQNIHDLFHVSHIEMTI